MTWFSAILGFASYLMFQDASLDKSKLDYYSGQIIDKGITDHNSSTKYGTRTSKVFFITLKDLDQILAVYNKGQEYGLLNENLLTGDNVEVYYKSSIKSDEPNIDVYEIKKGNQIILDDKEYRGRRKFGGIIAAIGVGLVITIGVFRDRSIVNSEDSKYSRQQKL